MKGLGRLFGFRAGPDTEQIIKMGALELLQAYGLRGYVRPGDAETESRVWTYLAMRLAEGGVPDWIENMRPYLVSQGVDLELLQNIGAPDGYRIILEGRRLLIYPYRNYVDWQTSIISSVQILNMLLERAGSAERGYILKGEEDDGLVLFMTPETHERIMADPALLPEDHLYDVGTYDRPSREATKVFPAAKTEEIPTA